MAISGFVVRELLPSVNNIPLLDAGACGEGLNLTGKLWQVSPPPRMPRNRKMDC
jgi:hypothetical protein